MIFYFFVICLCLYVYSYFYYNLLGESFESLFLLDVIGWIYECFLKMFFIFILILYSILSFRKGMEVNIFSFYYVNNNVCLFFVSMFKSIFKFCFFGI